MKTNTKTMRTIMFIIFGEDTPPLVGGEESSFSFQ